MALQIAYAVARHIADQAIARAPEEACGLLAGAWRTHQQVPARPQRRGGTLRTLPARPD